MKRYLAPLGLFALFALLVVVLAFGIHNAPQNGSKIIVSPLLGKPAPEFTLPQLLEPGQHYESKSLRGGWHLVNVWGTWCGGCRAEHATLLQIRDEGRVPIVGIDWKDEDAAATAWLSQLGNPYENVAADRDGRVAIDWGVYGAPETFVLDARGVIRYKHVGALTPAALASVIEPLLARLGQEDRP